MEENTFAKKPKRRSSILKSQSEDIEQETCTEFTVGGRKKPRRVSFAETRMVKKYDEHAGIQDNTQEEPAMHDSNISIQESTRTGSNADVGARVIQLSGVNGTGEGKDLPENKENVSVPGDAANHREGRATDLSNKKTVGVVAVNQERSGGAGTVTGAGTDAGVATCQVADDDDDEGLDDGHERTVNIRALFKKLSGMQGSEARLSMASIVGNTEECSAGEGEMDIDVSVMSFESPGDEASCGDNALAISDQAPLPSGQGYPLLVAGQALQRQQRLDDCHIGMAPAAYHSSQPGGQEDTEVDTSMTAGRPSSSERLCRTETDQRAMSLVTEGEPSGGASGLGISGSDYRSRGMSLTHIVDENETGGNDGADTNNLMLHTDDQFSHLVDQQVPQKPTATRRHDRDSSYADGDGNDDDTGAFIANWNAANNQGPQSVNTGTWGARLKPSMDVPTVQGHSIPLPPADGDEAVPVTGHQEGNNVVRVALGPLAESGISSCFEDAALSSGDQVTSKPRPSPGLSAFGASTTGLMEITSGQLVSASRSCSMLNPTRSGTGVSLPSPDTEQAENLVASQPPDASGAHGGDATATKYTEKSTGLVSDTGVAKIGLAAPSVEVLAALETSTEKDEMISKKVLINAITKMRSAIDRLETEVPKDIEYVRQLIPNTADGLVALDASKFDEPTTTLFQACVDLTSTNMLEFQRGIVKEIANEYSAELMKIKQMRAELAKKRQAAAKYDKLKRKWDEWIREEYELLSNINDEDIEAVIDFNTNVKAKKAEILSLQTGINKMNTECASLRLQNMRKRWESKKLQSLKLEVVAALDVVPNRPVLSSKQAITKPAYDNDTLFRLGVIPYIVVKETDNVLTVRCWRYEVSFNLYRDYDSISRVRSIDYRIIQVSSQPTNLDVRMAPLVTDCLERLRQSETSCEDAPTHPELRKAFFKIIWEQISAIRRLYQDVYYVLAYMDASYQDLMLTVKIGQGSENIIRLALSPLTYPSGITVIKAPTGKEKNVSKIAKKNMAPPGGQEQQYYLPVFLEQFRR